jgi:hypothetical protein
MHHWLTFINAYDNTRDSACSCTSKINHHKIKIQQNKFQSPPNTLHFRSILSTISQTHIMVKSLKFTLCHEGPGEKRGMALQSQHWIGRGGSIPCLSHFIPRKEPQGNRDGCRIYSSPPRFHSQTILKSCYYQLLSQDTTTYWYSIKSANMSNKSIWLFTLREPHTAHKDH